MSQLSKKIDEFQSQITFKKAIKYGNMPGIIPRIKALGDHFGHFAYFLATIYAAVGLIPKNHPYINSANTGKFGFRQVIGEAANNLTFSKDNIDKILIFFAVIIGLIILVMQIILALFFAVVTSANAQVCAGATSIFETGCPGTDLSWQFMNRIFGDVGVFTGAGGNTSGIITPFHTALHGMLTTYSTALLIVAVLIVAYYIMAVVAETAQTGVPFGQRFDSVWAPLRLVVALGLLVPITYGLNSAQWITLYAAKLGIGLANNTWSGFVTALLAQDATELISSPTSPAVQNLVRDVFMAETCKQSYNAIDKATQRSGRNARNTGGDKIVGPTCKVPGIDGGVNCDPGTGGSISTFLMARSNNVFSPNPNATARQATTASPNAVFYWGRRNGGSHDSYCGEIEFTIPDSVKQTHVKEIKNAYAKALDYLVIQMNLPFHNGITAPALFACKFGAQCDGITAAQFKDGSDLPSIQAEKQGWYDGAAPIIENAIAKAEAALQGSGELDTDRSDMDLKGWAGAGIFYMDIARLNHELTGAVKDQPKMVRTPGPLQEVGILGRTFRSDNGLEHEKMVGDAMNQSMQWFYSSSLTGQRTTLSLKADTTFEGLFASIIGAQGLFDMFENQNVHPLVQLTQIGDGLVSRSIGWLTGGVATAAIGGLASNIPVVGGAIGSISEKAVPVMIFLAAIGFVAGITLAYITPIMPFVYFMFGVVNWIMSIFEAMVGVPLWALGHLRIDGPGLPGSAGKEGYVIILQIFLRPVLMIFGLVGSVLIFSAAVMFLHDSFELLITVIKDGDTEVGFLGTFIYIIIYTYIVYTLATMSFKMIDNIPNGIMRYMGESASLYAEDYGKEADTIGGAGTAMVAAVGMDRAGQGMASAAGGVGKATGGGVKSLKNWAAGKKDAEMTKTDKK